MKLEASRMTRVNKLLHQTLADVLRRRWASETVAITITEVDTSPDLYDAKISYSVLTDDKASAVDFFRKYKGDIAVAMGKEIVLKRTPRLHFVYDPTLKNAANIDRLLNETATPALPKPEAKTGLKKKMKSEKAGSKKKA
jgi:ribosome-binding factor A